MATYQEDGAWDAGVAALRDQLDSFWNRALSGFQDLTDQLSEEEQ